MPNICIAFLRKVCYGMHKTSRFLRGCVVMAFLLDSIPNSVRQCLIFFYFYGDAGILQIAEANFKCI